MSSTLPGDIPGLLRRGTTGWCFDLTCKPVQCVVIAVGATAALVSFRQVWEGYFPDGSSLVQHYTVDVALADISIDLNDATSRAHAAWWVNDTMSQRPTGWLHQLSADLGADHFYSLVDAGYGRSMTNEQIDRLRRVVLYLAGRPL